MGEVSIWRWAVAEDLDTLFARLVAASDEGFAQIGHEIAQEGAEDLPSLDDVERDTEARLRAMNLPDDIMETMLKGFKASMAEVREAEGLADAEDHEPDGRLGVALASSHMFYDDPYASLAWAEIEQQVADLTARYRAAISEALGNGGQPLGAYLGLREERLWKDDVFDALTEAGLDAVFWVWAGADTVHFLSQWQEDKELPIDLEFGRAPKALFETTKAQVRR